MFDTCTRFKVAVDFFLHVIRNSNPIFTVLCFEQSVFEFEVTNSKIRECILEVGHWTKKKVAVTFNARVGDDSTASPSSAVYYLSLLPFICERVSYR